MRHPEQLPSEAFISNEPAERFDFFLWRSKRFGRVAYDNKGAVIPGRRPIFVSKLEILRMPNGRRTMRTLSVDGHW